MKRKFRMLLPDQCDKSFDIYSDDIRLSVDFDDVDHRAVLKEARKIVKTLNAFDALYEKYVDLEFRMRGLQK